MEVWDKYRDLLSRPNGRPVGVRNGQGQQPQVPQNPALSGMKFGGVVPGGGLSGPLPPPNIGYSSALPQQPPAKQMAPPATRLAGTVSPQLLQLFQGMANKQSGTPSSNQAGTQFASWKNMVMGQIGKPQSADMSNWQKLAQSQVIKPTQLSAPKSMPMAMGQIGTPSVIDTTKARQDQARQIEAAKQAQDPDAHITPTNVPFFPERPPDGWLSSLPAMSQENSLQNILNRMRQASGGFAQRGGGYGGPVF